jgi:hypothetical protein
LAELRANLPTGDAPNAQEVSALEAKAVREGMDRGLQLLQLIGANRTVLH